MANQLASLAVKINPEQIGYILFILTFLEMTVTLSIKIGLLSIDLKMKLTLG